MTHDPAQQRREVLDRVSALFRDTSGQLFGSALAAFGGDRAAADDVVQEVFQAILASPDPLRVLNLSKQRLRAWLHTTLKYKIVDRFRRRQREVLVEPVQLVDLEQPRDVPAAVRQLLVAELLDRAWAVIKQMPPTRRSVFWLKAHEYKTSEIADALRITPSTVRDHYRAGLQQLNDELGNGRNIFAALDDLEEGE